MTKELMQKLHALTKYAAGDWRGVNLQIHVVPGGAVNTSIFVEMPGGTSVSINRNDEDIEALLAEAEEKARAGLSNG